MKKILLSVAAVIVAAYSAFAVAIVPQPLSVTKHSGAFVALPSTTLVCAAEEFAPLAEYLQEYLPLSYTSKVAPKRFFIPRRIR